jgi:hypothetical protein
MEILQFILGLVCLLLSFVFFGSAFRIWNANPEEDRKNRILSQEFNTLTGRRKNWENVNNRSPSIISGLSYENGILYPRSRLSDDAVKRAIG